MQKVKVILKDHQGNKEKWVTTMDRLWLSYGNFSGKGKFKEIKIFNID